MIQSFDKINDIELSYNMLLAINKTENTMIELRSSKPSEPTKMHYLFSANGFMQDLSTATLQKHYRNLKYAFNLNYIAL